MNNKFISCLVLTLFSSLSWLHSQSVNLNSFQEIQALNIQECAVIQVNASWNYKNRVKIEKLSDLCYVAEIDLNNKSIGAVIQKEWNINPNEFFISLVPTQLHHLLQKTETANWLSNFQTVLLGGSAAWEELFDAARKYQIKLAPTYGMTETASQVATLKPQDFLAGNNSNGQVLPHAKIIVKNEIGETLYQNQIGNISIKANSLALGYYPDLFNNYESLVTDDLGFFDHQGYLKIVGRSNQKIITGGENVFPAEVEAAILTTGLVDDICVIGLADKYWGEVVTAVYVGKNFEVSRDKLLATIDEKLSKFKQPKYWLKVESLPRNYQGKINRELLKKIAIQRIGE